MNDMVNLRQIQRTRSARWTGAGEALARVAGGSTIYIEGGVGHPDTLIDALMKRGRSVGHLTVITSLMGESPSYCARDAADHFSVLSFRGSPEVKDAIVAGQVDVVPANLSAIPDLLSGPLRPNVALVQLTPPNSAGYCSLGQSVLYHKAALRAADLVIAEVNPQMPWTFGDSLVHLSEIDFLVEGKHALPTLQQIEPAAAELRLAENVIKYVPDGATVQVGMGSVAQAIMEKLQSRSGLRIHAGLLSDAVMRLAHSGSLVDGDGAIVSGAFYGSDQLYRFIDRNPQVTLRSVEYTHNVDVMRGLAPFISINSALEVDLTGQVNAEVIRGLPISGTGGQGDFMRGAAVTDGGVAIIAMTATTRNKGYSKIVNTLAGPGVVTTPKIDVDLVITEFGAANLRGKGLRQRAEALLAIADPSFLPALEKGARDSWNLK